VKNVPNEDLSPKTADADAPGKWSMLAVGSLLQLSRASGLTVVKHPPLFPERALQLP